MPKLVLNFWDFFSDRCFSVGTYKVTDMYCRLQLPIDSYSSNGCFSLLFMTDSCSKVYLSDTELSIEYPITPPTMQQKENTA